MKDTINPLSSDWAVLCHLDCDARTSFAEIGRRIGMTKEGVKSAAMRLEKRGIISQYMTVVDVSKLGLSPYVIYAQLRAKDAKEREMVIRALCQRPEIYWVSRMAGKFELLFAVTARNIMEFSMMLRTIMHRYGSQLGRIAINTRLQTIQFPRNYLSQRAPARTVHVPKKPLSFGESQKVIDLAQRDRQLINEISGNARVSTTELARKLKSPRSTVHRRLQALESRGIIQGYAACVHAERFGYQIYRMLISTFSKSFDVAESIYRFARVHPNVVYVDFGIGEWDAELTVEVRNQDELQILLSELRLKIGSDISEIELLIVFEDNVKFQFHV